MYFISFPCTKNPTNLITNSMYSILDTFVVWLLRPPKTIYPVFRLLRPPKKYIFGFYSLEIYTNKGIRIYQSNHYLIGVNKGKKKKKIQQKMSLSPLLGYATTMHTMKNDLVTNNSNAPKLSQESKD
jgi:hypothetical protein